jgi:hypothetical protein
MGKGKEEEVDALNLGYTSPTLFDISYAEECNDVQHVPAQKASRFRSEGDNILGLLQRSYQIQFST